MFDQTNAFGIPYRLSNNGISFNITSDICSNDIEYTTGQILFSGLIVTSQQSCKPNTGNAGNYYSWPTATAGGKSTIEDYNETNSICSKGWQLIVIDSNDSKSYSALLNKNYSRSGNRGINLPLTFILSGYYDEGSIYARASTGYYWTSTATSSSIGAKYAYITKDSVTPSYGHYSYYSRDNGYSLRCVAKNHKKYLRAHKHGGYIKGEENYIRTDMVIRRKW